MTDTGSSVSCVNTAREQVASKPMPRIVEASTLFWSIALCTELHMHLQISVVDCSYSKISVERFFDRRLGLLG